ncbi:MAG: permease [Candidatus Thorarchaeota archaeon]
MNEESEVPSPDLKDAKEKSFFKRHLDAIMLEGFLVVLLAFFFIVVYLTQPSQIQYALDFSATNLIETIPIFIVASFLAGWMDAWIDRDLITRFLTGRNLLVGLTIVTCVGIVTPGPIYSIFPLIYVLKRKGVGSHYLIAFMTGQTLMGSLRIPLELHYLGLNFFIF